MDLINEDIDDEELKLVLMESQGGLEDILMGDENPSK